MMEKRIGLAALDVEKYSKIGTQDLKNGQLDQALEAFKYAYKRSHELEDGFTERACAFNLGAAYIAMGQPKRGLEILQKAVPPENRREGKSNGDLYFNFGLGYEGVGNFEDAARNYTKAMEEYRTERDNSEMEIETLEKLAQIYSRTKNAFAVDAYIQLVQLYENTNNPANYLKHMKALFEKAYHLYQSGRKAETEIAADECMKITEKCGANVDVGYILNDLGLVYTQLQKYDRALTCFEQALPMVRSKPLDKKQEAVLLQNLGATYNFMGDYQRAVGFHESAAKLHAELRNRNSQGQCFANLAFAFSQLNDPESAGEAFLHAYQAAKDTGDKRTQWQVTEGLGAVAFNKGQINKAIAYFKQALSILSTCDPNNVAQDRIVGKLTHALQVQVAIQTGSKLQPHKQDKKEPESKTAVTTVADVQQKFVVNEDGKVRYGVGKRFIRVNRHGSSKRFIKVARGISTPSLIEGGVSLRSSILSENSMSEEETSTSDESEESDFDEVKEEYLRKIRADSVTKGKIENKIQEVSEESEEESEDTISSEEEETETESEEEVTEKHDNEEDDMESKAVKEEMRKIFQAGENDDEGEDTVEEAESRELGDEKTAEKKVVGYEETAVKRVVGDEETAVKRVVGYEETEVKRPITPKVKIEQASKKDSDSESDSESEHPPVPTQSPMPTDSFVRTYDNPLARQEGSEAKNRRTKYADIDFLSPVRTSEQDDNDPVYQSIRTGDRTLIQPEDSPLQDDQQQPDFSKFENLPRGENEHESRAEKERRLYEEHQKYRQRQSEAPPLPDRKMDQKPSKTCVVM